MKGAIINGNNCMQSISRLHSGDLVNAYYVAFISLPGFEIRYLWYIDTYRYESSKKQQ